MGETEFSVGPEEGEYTEDEIGGGWVQGEWDREKRKAEKGKEGIEV